MKKKKLIKYSKARVLLSDVLPYETPLTFSNRHLYNFINQHQIDYNYDTNQKTPAYLTYENPKNNGALDNLIKIIFDTESRVEEKNQIKKANERKIPFTYKIRHKENSFRELTVPHPKSQLEIIHFYDNYKELILYYSKQSHYSIRHPDAISKYIFINDSLHSKVKGDENDSLEDSEQEYESLKTFFTYKKYPNIHKFYEHYRYHRAEKKYDKLFKFDIASCFDSIYTHSIAWAIYSKEYIKNNLTTVYLDFPNCFDHLMQNANYGETNGIIIGPEISRIFAEIILQQIDKRVEYSLKTKGKFNNELPLILKTDYEIYRYVDDYFVFYNEEKTKDRIIEDFQIQLKEFKLSVNESKSKLYEKPLITELTIAKNKIVDLFENEISFKIEDESKTEGVKSLKMKTKCNSNSLIIKFKIILKESNVGYKDIMNFTLALISKRVEKYLVKFEEFYDELLKGTVEFSVTPITAVFNSLNFANNLKQQEKFTNFLLNILDFMFFIYAVDPRVNFSIKVCQIISKIKSTYSKKVKFFTGRYNDERTKEGKIYAKPIFKIEKFNQDKVYKKVSDEIILILEKYKIHNHVQIETLFLITALSELGKDYKLTESQISKYFKLENDEIITCSLHINYFVLTTLLFYIKNSTEYIRIKIAVQKCILQKIESETNKVTKRAELVFLFLDMIVCPYVDNHFKREIMVLFNVTTKEDQDNLFQFKKNQKYWFTKWDNFNFAKEIESKIAQEPY